MVLLPQRLTALLAVLLVSTTNARTVLMDAAGSLQLQNIPGQVSTAGGVVTLVSSPGTPSELFQDDDAGVLSLDSDKAVPCLSCRGATLSGTSDQERASLATTSLVSDAIVVDGVTVGDVEAGLRNSRHARTLTALFRARVKLQQEKTKQTLILCLHDSDEESSEYQAQVESELEALYKAAATETKEAGSFGDMYDVQVVSVSPTDAGKVLSIASEAAKSAEHGAESPELSLALAEAYNKVKESGVGAVALDPPHIAGAFVMVANAYEKQSRACRAQLAAWKARVARGLWIDSFGSACEALRKRVLGAFDTETLSASGLLLVSEYRLEHRKQLQNMLDTSLEELFAGQIANLEKSTMKRFRAQLLKTLNSPAESAIDANAAALRQCTFNFESIVEDLEVPALGLTKDRPTRVMASKLTDVLETFDDSPEAKLKRTSQVEKAVNRERKPSQRAIDFGLDLVAMLRPDGFGSLQGFAGYQLGGNSITFGVHNDADDPQVISQFGGVRPPLLRVQPKLRVDVEL